MAFRNNGQQKPREEGGVPEHELRKVFGAESNNVIVLCVPVTLQGYSPCTRLTQRRLGDVHQS